MDLLDRSEDEEQRGSHCGGSSGSSSSGRGSRFGARRLKPRSHSHHQLLLMDSVGNGNGGCRAPLQEGAEAVPLPDYERLSQSARLPDDPKSPLLPPPAAAELQGASPRQQQKPAAWRLIEYVRSRHKPGSSDGDSRSSDGEKERDDGGGEECGKEASEDKETAAKKKKKKRSSWLPDPDRRWPVQGFY